ncbi:MAG: DUF115 domain-containing protein [Lachnospiraceae bacterium]|nr:DUF115 domain-containing protein [Lachnospiraceae bacterium]
MEEQIQLMYKDALIVAGLQETLYQASVGSEKKMKEAWEQASAGISGLLLRVGNQSMPAGNVLLRAWKAARESGDDFRKLTACIASTLIPVLIDSLQVLYGKISFTAGKWEFSKADTGFFTVKDLERGKYLYEPFDPMREAAEQARMLYRGEMASFHILGSGLGYLAWQIWEKSEHTAKLYIYEDDQVMLQMAFRYGTLSWIDKDHLILVDNSDTERMLKSFLYAEDLSGGNHYVSDWKLRAYPDSPFGKQVDSFDFNQRTGRECGLRQAINRRENREQGFEDISRLVRDHSPEGGEFIVVSAGPSLDDNIAFLRESVGKKRIIVVNTALKRLEKEGIRPDAVVMIDPFQRLRSHIEGIETFTEGIPLITVEEGSSDFIKLFRGPVYMIPTEEADGGYHWSFGGTVASLGLDLAYYLGAEKIYLIGSDLATPNGANYAGGLAHDSKSGVTEGIEVPSTDGGMVHTKLLYQAFREILEAQIAAHPEVKVYNMSKHGAAIKGTEAFYKS